MSRRSNGQGHTYKVGSSYRTVIHHNGHIVTAMAATVQESRKRAKEKLEKLPTVSTGKSALPQSKIALGTYLLTWLEEEHKHQIAHSTWKRYRALATHHIVPVIGQIPLRKIVPSDIQLVLSLGEISRGRWVNAWYWLPKNKRNHRAPCYLRPGLGKYLKNPNVRTILKHLNHNL
ncbi:Integrase, SAM-like, N-terminal [Candidatus Planktophila dulcis]